MSKQQNSLLELCGKEKSGGRKNVKDNNLYGSLYIANYNKVYHIEDTYNYFLSLFCDFLSP